MHQAKDSPHRFITQIANVKPDSAIHCNAQVGHFLGPENCILRYIPGNTYTHVQGCLLAYCSSLVARKRSSINIDQMGNGCVQCGTVIGWNITQKLEEADQIDMSAQKALKSMLNGEKSSFGVIHNLYIFLWIRLQVQKDI